MLIIMYGLFDLIRFANFELPEALAKESALSCPISRQARVSPAAMASFSLALQLRAAERAVKADMPRRAMATRILLFCEVLSTMLVIQIGQFTHPVAWLKWSTEALKFYPARFIHLVFLNLLTRPWILFRPCFGKLCGRRHTAATAEALSLVPLLMLATVALGRCRCSLLGLESKDISCWST